MSIERAARVAAPVALALFALLGAITGQRPLLLGLGVGGAIALLGVMLAWRGTTGWSLVAQLALTTAGIVVLGHAQSSNLVWMGLCVSAAWVALTSSLPVTVVAGVGLGATVVFEWTQQTEEVGWFPWLVGTGFTLVACTFARQLRVTLEQLRAAQHQLAERSRAEERSRIAGEVHDVLGHALTVSLLHIASARLALDEDRPAAERALEDAERLTRDALDEVRASVGLMRIDDRGTTAPLPDAGAIPSLVASFRTAGAEAQLHVNGDLAVLGPTRGLVAYRIVQEALTNATRHAPGQPVTVDITVEDAGARVLIRNRGEVGSSIVPGDGLSGMRERAEAVGGWLHAGASENDVRGGWLVEAVLPA